MYLHRLAYGCSLLMVAILPWSYPWQLLLARYPTWDTYAALAVWALNRVRRTSGRCTDLRYKFKLIFCASHFFGLDAITSTIRASGYLLLSRV